MSPFVKTLPSKQQLRAILQKIRDRQFLRPKLTVRERRAVYLIETHRIEQFVAEFPGNEVEL